MKRIERPKEFDAVLIHCLGYDMRPKVPFGERPAIRGRLNIIAARYLEDEGIKVKNFVFSGGPLAGRNTPLSQLNAAEFTRRTGTNVNSIIIDKTARTTSMELQVLKRLANEHGWKTLGDLSTKTHKRKKLVEKIFQEGKHKVTIFNMEDVLEHIPDDKRRDGYVKFSNRMHRSLVGLRFTAYELIKDLLFKIPYAEKLAEKVTERFTFQAT